MIFSFSKYHGTGNDFILIDNREKKFTPDQDVIESLCHRRFGIGADGLILLENSDDLDFEMKYFNADGNEGSLCGNGGRCITAFAHRLGAIGSKARFMASDGIHESEIISGLKNENDKTIRLKMNPVELYKKVNETIWLDTGSPHFVVPVDSLDTFDVVKEGREIRYNEPFKINGINVDFISRKENELMMRVYERGVEDETYSSGTGAVASVLAASILGWIGHSGPSEIITKGGKLNVGFKKKENTFVNIWLEGPATKIFDGEIQF